MIYKDNFDGPVTHSQPLAENTYNAAGERTKKVTPSATTYYIRGQGQIMAEYDGSGGSGNLVYNYVYANPAGGGANGRRIGRKNGADYDYIHNDMLGSARRITSYSTWERHYYPFGQDLLALPMSALWASHP